MTVKVTLAMKVTSDSDIESFVRYKYTTHTHIEHTHNVYSKFHYIGKRNEKAYGPFIFTQVCKRIHIIQIYIISNKKKTYLFLTSSSSSSRTSVETLTLVSMPSYLSDIVFSL